MVEHLKTQSISGISRFVSQFALPFLIFNFISSNHSCAANLKFVAGSALQKVVVLVGLALLMSFTRFGSLDWSITLSQSSPCQIHLSWVAAKLLIQGHQFPPNDHVGDPTEANYYDTENPSASPGLCFT
ncbi:hypothetical protein PIB30_077746 [Stylosanthes scabra]|uniref:Uncharacterized protein n=1 Tax=Stylosanthes scabra TaxID=79078 RepID=A0ABU6YQZ5_9FABA|nr:hypothetical protein [Stylosanthes scabra]